MDNSIWMICGILFLAGIVIIGIGLVLKSLEEGKRDYQEKVQGTVVDVEEEHQADERGVVKVQLYPVIAYFAKGHLYRERTQKGYKPCPYRINQQVMVKFHHKDPKNFRFAEEVKESHVGTLIYAGGLVICGLSILIFILFSAAGV